ncbi:MAG: hypothetical protein ING12_16730 [Roseomonas sp.]|nr:hypothetical protein [Roseomonas sp.]
MMAPSLVVATCFLSAVDDVSPHPKNLISDDWYKAGFFSGDEGSERFSDAFGQGRIIA